MHYNFDLQCQMSKSHHNYIHVLQVVSVKIIIKNIYISWKYERKFTLTFAFKDHLDQSHKIDSGHNGYGKSQYYL